MNFGLYHHCQICLAKSGVSLTSPPSLKPGLSGSPRKSQCFFRASLPLPQLMVFIRVQAQDVFVGFFLNPGQFDQLPGMVELAGNPNSLLPGYTYHASVPARISFFGRVSLG